MDVKLSQLSNVSSLELTDLFEISRSIGGGYYESRSVSYQGLISSIYGLRTITVNKSGVSDYNTIKEALEYASTVAGPSNSIAVLVYPGTYLEDNPLVVPDYVSIVSVGGQFTTAVGALNADVIFSLGYRTRISGLSVQATGAAGYLGTTAFYMTKALNIVEDSIVVNCENAYWTDGVYSTGSAILDCGVLNFTTSKVVRAYYSTDNAEMVIKTSLTNSSNPSNLIDYGLYCDNSKIYCSSINLSECGVALYCDNGGSIEINSSYAESGDRGILIGPNGYNSSIDANGFNISQSMSGNHVEIQSVTGHVDLIGSYESYKRSIISGATFHSVAQDESTGGTTIIGNTRVEDRFDIGVAGKSELGLQIGMDVGTGKSYSIDRIGTPIVEFWDYDDSAPSGSKFTKMANNSGTILTDDGDALIVGCRYDYSAIKLDVDQAANLGSTSIVTEHWDGSQWVEHFTATYGNEKFTSRLNNFLQNIETQYIEHGKDVYDDWDSAGDVLDEIPDWDLGTDMYAVRFRNNGGSLITPAIISNGKVKSDNFSIQESGQAVSWGRNRLAEVISVEAGNWDPDSLNPPSLVTVPVTSNISLTNHPSFLDNSLCRSSIFTKVPFWADTSTPLGLNIGIFCPTSATGDVNFVLRVAVVRGGLVVGSITEDVYSTVTTMSGVSGKLQSLSQEINIQGFQPGWNLIVGIERDSTSSNPIDTFNGDVVCMAMGFYYTRKIIG